jgi:hypothetical protein
VTSQLKNFTINRSNLAIQTYPEQKDIDVPSHMPVQRKPLASRFSVALAIFIVLDLVVRFQFHADPYNLPERSFIWWAVQDYRHLKQTPDIILFGSSLMLAAINESDAARYNKLIDSATHHRSLYLEELLKNKLSKPISTFSFAIGGQMASDAYAIASNFITPARKPQLIIWGIAPRDLLDAAFPGAATSDTAQYMNKIAGRDLIPSDHMTFNTIIDQLLRHASSIYANRPNFVYSLKQSTRALQASSIMSQVIPKSDNAGRATMVRQLMNPRDGSMGDIEIGEWLIAASTKPSTELKDNTQEYFLRYHPIKPKTFNSQVSYLQKFLERQRNLGVKVLLVNMPLTEKNMALLPATTYNQYLSTLKRLANTYGANVVDFNHDSHFLVSDFFDTAHLNGLGSEKLLSLISNCLETILPNYKLAAKETSSPNL